MPRFNGKVRCYIDDRTNILGLPFDHNGVRYDQMTNFMLARKYNILILWRSFFFASVPIHAEKIFIDLHDY